MLWSEVKVELEKVDEEGLIPPLNRLTSARGVLIAGVGLGPGVA